MKNYKFIKDSKGVKIFTEIPNQGSLSDYISNKSGTAAYDKNTVSLLNNFVLSMTKFSEQFRNKGVGTLHIRNLFVHNNRICIGEPLLITDEV